jgi:hypothetical protein
MTVHALVLFAHVVAATVLVGGSLVAPFARHAIRDAPTLGALRPWLSFVRNSTRLHPLAALVLLASGVYLAAGRWSEGWLPVSTALFVVTSLVAVKAVGARGERIAALAASAGEGPIGPDIDALRRSAAWGVAGDVLVANDLAALFLMSVQPGLLASIAAVVVSNGVVAALRAVRGGAPAPAPAPEAHGS